MKITLTTRQADILRHRLEAPDALAEALEVYHPDDVRDVADLLLGALTANAIDTGPAEEADGVACARLLTREVLVDCLEGSTYVGAAKDDVSSQAIAGFCISGDNLAEKIGAYVGRDVFFATY